MPALLSLVTSVKDYIEIAHKLVETQNTNFFLSGGRDSGLTGEGLFGIRDYNEFGAVLTYVVLSVKEFLTNFLTFSWLKNIWSLPLVVPDVASAMISEISVLDSYFTNAFSFLENGLSTNLNSNANTLSMATDNLVNAQKLTQNPALFGFEKFVIGFLNSFFLFLPTSTAHLITLRRFVMQGIEAGFIAGLGTIAGNFLWLASIILGLRFIVIPWLSLDIFRYVLGFMLLVKYLWDSSKELNKGRSTTLETNSKIQIFALNFLLALTEQTSIYPFISNMSFGADGSIIEGFSSFGLSSDNPFLFFGIHTCYLLGILLGSFSLLQFTVWFWENPAFSIYMWMISSYRVTTSSYYKVLNFVFLYLTMLCAISSIPYFGLDYTVTNPLGMIPQDRIIEQRSFSASGPGEPILPEASFLGVKPTDKNSRIRDGVHARRERWKERLIKYQAFDASLYDQGAYDILTVEDLNYGFDRFWLRRKMRNHQIRFRLFPGPWMRSLKKQLNKPGFTGPRTEFFRILFEQYYHPSFHATAAKNKTLFIKKETQNSNLVVRPTAAQSILVPAAISSTTDTDGLTTSTKRRSVEVFKTKKGLVSEYSALRKFSQNVNTRLKAYAAASPVTGSQNTLVGISNSDNGKDTKLIYSKSLKSLLNKINKDYTKTNLNLFRSLSKNLLVPTKNTTIVDVNNFSSNGPSYGKTSAWSSQTDSPIFESLKKTSMRKPLSKKERFLLIAGAQKDNLRVAGATGLNLNNSIAALNVYSQKNEAFKRKLQYYSTAVTRKFSVGNNAPYFKTILKRAFYYHKPTLRQKRTLFTAAMRRGFRKKSVMPKKLTYTTNSLTTAPIGGIVTASGTESLSTMAAPNNGQTSVVLPTQQYSVLGKRASRYRYQIYKDVLQHWYYTPFNRLLLKFDVDSFINRQPKSHFLTKKEERLLHLRRVLLAEHYNTLRWYTYMQHYRTMKSRIGGTKSFASTAYNQQFQGTFKKIRHLFAITPIQTGSDLSILKFDQPLYSDSNVSGLALNAQMANVDTTSDRKGNQKRKYAISAYKHEDLTKDSVVSSSQASNVIDQSLSAVGGLVKAEQQTRYEKMREYINNKNYSSLTALLVGQVGDAEAVNTSTSLGVTNARSTEANLNTELVLLDLLKEAKNRLNNPAGFMKNYISHRIDKREQRNNETSKELRSQLETLKTWLSPNALSSSETQMATNTAGTRSVFETTTGTRKALNDGMFVLNNINPSLQSKAFITKQAALRKYKDSSVNKYLFNAKKEQIQQTLISLKNATMLVDKLRNNKALSARGGDALSLRKTVTNVQSLLNTVVKPFVLVQNKFLTKRTNKNLEWWRQKQRVLNKRSSSRKKERLNYLEANINGKQQTKASDLFAKGSSYLLPVDAKKVTSTTGSMALNSNIKLDLIPEGVLRKKTDNSFGDAPQDTTAKKVYQQFFLRKFRKKRSRGKMYRKPYYANILRPKNASNVGISSQEVVSNYLDNFNGVLDSKALAALQNDMRANAVMSTTKDDKATMFKAFKQNLAKTIAAQVSVSTEGSSEEQKVNNLKNLLIQGSIKKSPSKKRSKRASRKRKRQKFSLNHDRYRKRQNHGLGKLRTLAKKMKRIKSTQEFQNWWWNTYLPNYISRTTQQSQAAERITTTVTPNLSNSRYAPLSTAKALDLKKVVPSQSNSQLSLSLETKQDVPLSTQTSNETILDQIYGNFVDSSLTKPTAGNSINGTESNYNPKFNSTTTIPFYAGWDESLRKFVVTNRLLSRRDAGSEVNLNGIFATNSSKSATQGAVEPNWQFTSAPINGLNEASFLYLQTEMPFNSYTIDQFIPNNQSFYAPLGWKRFQFRHSLLKNWLNNSKSTQNNLGNSNKAIYLTTNSISNLEYFRGLDSSPRNAISKQSNNLQNRRVKKRYKLLKQTPMQLMYVPTGSLLTETLPSHYISVFDKQYRFPRNRYIKRNLPKANTNSMAKNLTVADYSANGQPVDFTLRKRVKPKRKYHKKRFTKKDGLIFPRRRKFGSDEIQGQEEFRLRPSMRANQNLKNGATKAKKQSRNSGKANPIRLRQLRRREFQQVFKPLQRYQPRNGGFTWPGDYLRLQIIPMPKLEPTLVNTQNVSTSAGAKTKVKTKINSQPIGLLPRKYLLQKHNLKVFKKKMALKYST